MFNEFSAGAFFFHEDVSFVLFSSHHLISHAAAPDRAVISVDAEVKREERAAFMTRSHLERNRHAVKLNVLFLVPVTL